MPSAMWPAGCSSRMSPDIMLGVIIRSALSGAARRKNGLQPHPLGHLHRPRTGPGRPDRGAGAGPLHGVRRGTGAVRVFNHNDRAIAERKTTGFDQGHGGQGPAGGRVHCGGIRRASLANRLVVVCDSEQWPEDETCGGNMVAPYPTHRARSTSVQRGPIFPPACLIVNLVNVRGSICPALASVNCRFEMMLNSRFRVRFLILTSSLCHAGRSADLCALGRAVPRGFPGCRGWSGRRSRRWRCWPKPRWTARAGRGTAAKMRGSITLFCAAMRSRQLMLSSPIPAAEIAKTFDLRDPPAP